MIPFPPSIEQSQYDVIVVGAGHAGIEAALAAARSGCSVLMITINVSSVGQMSCNPAIGGIGKGHLVREIDALGGEMGRAIDECGIQFRRLNTRKGPAVQASRAQADKRRYRERMRRVVRSTDGLTVMEGEVCDLVLCGGRVAGVVMGSGQKVRATSVVLTTGTFLEGLLHIGGLRRSGGRAGDRASRGLSDALRRLGLETGRLKTGTCPRLDARTIDYSILEEQPGDDPAPRFSFDDPSPRLSQVSCYVTHTNGITHRVIHENLHLSPLYSGQIRSRGPRYCPSIEDKVVKFPHRDRHRIFLEPEGLDTHEVYPNGLSTSLPLEVQREFVRTIKGLENATLVRPGYAIEYDYVAPTQLDPSLAVRGTAGLFLAGQINGTTGYEEAAAQGLMAGINAVRYVRHQDPFTLTRSEAYIGVLIDDLVTRGVDGEPYRMFTSRAEYRLLLREDNADLRLAKQARELGLLDERRMTRLTEKAQGVSAGIAALARTRVDPSSALNRMLAATMSPPLTCPLAAAELLRRPGITYALIASVVGLPRFDSEIERQLEIIAAYQGYIDRIDEEVERMRGLESARVPEDLDYRAVAGLSSEAREKLERIRPCSLGQASRISGLTPVTVSALAVHLKRLERAR